MKKLIICTFLAILVISLNSCMTVKEYQKVYLNDEDMQLRNRDIESFETSFETSREAASGANGSKSGGGCGCN